MTGDSGGPPNDVEADLGARVATLEAALADFALRYSALEWIVEQHFARYLVDLDHEEAAAFLRGIKQPGGAPYQVTAEGQQSPVTGDAEARMLAYTAHIADKIDERVRQGIRRR